MRDTVVPAAPEEVPSNRTKRQVSQIFVILTIILRGRAGYQMIDNQRGA